MFDQDHQITYNGIPPNFFPSPNFVFQSPHDHQEATSFHPSLLPPASNTNPQDHHFTGAAPALMVGKRSSSSSMGGFGGVEVCDQELSMEEQENLSDVVEGSAAPGERKMKRLNLEQVRTLERSFEMGNKLEPERKMQMARALGLQPRQIAIWFQNKRARWKTKQLEKDFDALKCHFDAIQAENEALQAHNKRLQAEILALKGIENIESINLNKETEGSCSNRSENFSSELNLDISPPTTTDHHVPREQNDFFPSYQQIISRSSTSQARPAEMISSRATAGVETTWGSWVERLKKVQVSEVGSRGRSSGGGWGRRRLGSQAVVSSPPNQTDLVVKPQTGGLLRDRPQCLLPPAGESGGERGQNLGSREFGRDRKRIGSILFSVLATLLIFGTFLPPGAGAAGGGGAVGKRLRFRGSGEFKILQVADMHYADGRRTGCLDVFSNETATCSDLNTTAFIYRVVRDEKPDLIVFTGDNIFGFDSSDSTKSMNMAFAPAVSFKLPWAAVLGNHDQEGTLSREGVMRHIVSMPYTLSLLNPDGLEIDGFGNYNLEVSGPDDSPLANKSVLNLYYLDSGDYSTVPVIPGYGWIKPSQQLWLQQTSSYLQKEYMSVPEAQKAPAPGLIYFHIPLPEFSSFDASNFTGVKQEGISSASINSGLFTTMAEAGDVKAVFVGHDHLNDFCGKLMDIQLCYAGGFGYHAYGKAGWSRRARVVSAHLEKTTDGKWAGVKLIKTWKRLDDQSLSTIDSQILWSKGTNGRRRKSATGGRV